MRRPAVQATRQHILDYLRHNRDASVKELGRVLRLTATGVRQHLAILEEEGYVTSFEERGKVGRPALRFYLTEEGDAHFPKQYDTLANALIDEVRTAFGSDGLQRVVRGVAHRQADEQAAHIPAGASDETRVEAAARMVRSSGSIADWERSGETFLLHQRTCPYPGVARRNSVTCALDVALVRELTKMDARLTESLVRGDGCCTYRLVPDENASRGASQAAAEARRRSAHPERVEPRVLDTEVVTELV